jgi:tRNA threonylcarbamoyladenosine modification (KEOPS) complex  Pcc1 subunit
MTAVEAHWTATVSVKTTNVALLTMVERSLGPEAQREVPRTQADLHRASPGSLELQISARDSGAMRAALNTYLGWVHLSLATVRSGTAAAPIPPSE